MVNMSIDETDISLISLYAPNNMNERSVFFKKTNNWIDKHAVYKNSLLIAGDMNCCLKEVDRKPISKINDYSKKDLRKYLRIII